MDPHNKQSLLSELKNFLQFLCEAKSCNLESVINSSVTLVKECPPARDAVLQFYFQLLDDYCGEFCIAKVQWLASGDSTFVNIPIVSERVGPIISRFILDSKKELPPTVTTDYSLRKNSTESRKRSESSDDGKIAATPQSPPPAGAYPVTSQSSVDSDVNCSAVMSALEFHFDLIKDALISLSKTEPAMAKFVTEWSLELAAKLSCKYSQLNEIASNEKTVSNDPKTQLTKSLKFWLECPAMKMLTDLMIASTESIEIELMLKQLLQYSPHSDWILAHLITTISTNSSSTLYIEQLMLSAASSSSITCILAYLSEHNPQAIASCSKANVSFLLQLCVNSKPLLELLAIESIKFVNLKVLSELASSPEAKNLDDHIMYCLLNAPNAFELLKLAFDITKDPNASESLKTKTFHILSLIITNIHEHVYATKHAAFSDEPPILKLLKDNIKGLVEYSSKTLDTFSSRLQLRLLHLLCMHYGSDFIPEVIHNILNCRLQEINISSFRSPIQSQLLSSLLKSLKMQFGAKINDCLSNTLNLELEKNVHFWCNLLAVIENDQTCSLDLDLLTTFVNEKQNESQFYDYFILKLLLLTMEKFSAGVSKPRYRLCHYLVFEYFKLIRQQQNCEEKDIDVYMESIITCQKCLSILAKALDINQLILSRVLLEFSLENSALFCQKNGVFKQVLDKNTSNFSLLKENQLQGPGYSAKFKKISLMGKREVLMNQDNPVNFTNLINQQLVLDAFHCCVKDFAMFAKLLVQCVSPDLIYNDLPWPDEDFRDQMQQLRVTIERDLCVSRLFETNPLLWDICEMIGKAGHLRSCLVIIRALMSVQRTYWTSTTSGKENIEYTQKLLNLLSSNEILPSNPFKYISLVLPQLQAWEVSCVLSDVCKYLKDSTYSNTKIPVKPYVERLRIIMAQNLPGSLFVKIFQNL